MAAAEGAADALAAAAAASLSRWWLSSAFQRTWLRLAVQAGVTVLVLMSIFSPPAVWDLHRCEGRRRRRLAASFRCRLAHPPPHLHSPSSSSFDVVLANPTIILVLTNLGILFSTGIPILKIAFEGLVGALAGGATVLAVTYAAHGISGGAPGVLKAAMTMLLGCPPLLLATATRYRWPQHVGLAGIFFNLTVTVGLAVCYLQSTELGPPLLPVLAKRQRCVPARPPSADRTATSSPLLPQCPPALPLLPLLQPVSIRSLLVVVCGPGGPVHGGSGHLCPPPPRRLGRAQAAGARAAAGGPKRGSGWAAARGLLQRR